MFAEAAGFSTSHPCSKSSSPTLHAKTMPLSHGRKMHRSPPDAPPCPETRGNEDSSAIDASGMALKWRCGWRAEAAFTFTLACIRAGPCPLHQAEAAASSPQHRRVQSAAGSSLFILAVTQRSPVPTSFAEVSAKHAGLIRLSALQTLRRPMSAVTR